MSVAMSKIPLAPKSQEMLKVSLRWRKPTNIAPQLVNQLMEIIKASQYSPSRVQNTNIRFDAGLHIHPTRQSYIVPQGFVDSFFMF